MGPYSDVPIDQIEVELKQFLASGGRPEQHPHVRSYHLGVPEGGFDVVCSVEVASSWSNKEKISCSACRTAKKFTSGGYILRHENGYLYAVGPVCGQADYKIRRKDALSNYHVRQRRRELELELSEFLYRFCELKEKFIHYKTCLNDAFRLRAAIKRENPEFFRCLKEAASSGGRLGTNYSSLWYVDGPKQVKVNGTDFFREPWQVQDSFKLFLDVEPLFHSVLGDIDDYLDVPVPQIRKQLSSLYKLEESFYDIDSLMETGRQFFNVENIYKIHKWVGTLNNISVLDFGYSIDSNEFKLIFGHGNEVRLSDFLFRMFRGGSDG